MQTIDTSLSINDIVRRYPAAMSLLSRRGIDTCCDGGLTLATAAADADLDLSVLVREIADVATKDSEETP